MSVHLVTCAAEIPLKPSEKLILLCLAENANSRDAIAFPGMEGLRMWSGLSKSRVLEILNVLVELRLIEQVGRGHRGRAAEFRVFPYGCCAGHGKEEGSGWQDPERAVESPAHRTLTLPKGPVSDSIGSGFEAQRVRPTGPPPTTPLTTSPSELRTEVSETARSRPELHVVGGIA